jgi:hypothetical protein
MADIFICYRRNDSEGYAGRLHDHLVERFGARAVFVDVDNLHPGQDFNQVIQRTLQRSSVVLVVIGRHWMDQRLRNEGDYVRQEITAAMKGRKRLIPVLVGDAQMPASDNLPPELAPLVGKQAIPLRHPTWKADVARLITSLQRTLARKKTTVAKAQAKPASKAKGEQRANAKKTGGTASTASRPPARPKHGKSETSSPKPTLRGGKKASPAPSRVRPDSEAEKRRRADAAPDSGSQRAKRSPSKAMDGNAATSPGAARARRKKPSGASATRTAGGGGGNAGGSSGAKSGSKAAGRGHRKKKPSTTAP